MYSPLDLLEKIQMAGERMVISSLHYRYLAINSPGGIPCITRTTSDGNTVYTSNQRKLLNLGKDRNDYSAVTIRKKDCIRNVETVQYNTRTL